VRCARDRPEGGPVTTGSAAAAAATSRAALRHQPRLERQHDDLHPVAQPQLLEDVRDVVLTVVSPMKSSCPISALESRRDQADDLLLAGRQLVERPAGRPVTAAA